MNWIVLVLVACSADSCTVVESEANLVEESRETAIRERCDKAPNCLEMRRGIFVIRQLQPAPAPIPKAPVPSPPASSARVPGARA